MKKTLTMILAFALVFALGVGGTLAWLVDDTDTITNTFTYSNIDITLTEEVPEDKDNIKMVPGATIDKDPKATVVVGSEECWLFVEVEASENFAEYMKYTIADGWTEVETNVYGRAIAAADMGKPISILKNDQVTVNDDVTKEMMDAIKNGTEDEPTLAFTAYAIQSANIEADTAAEAWDIYKAN